MRYEEPIGDRLIDYSTSIRPTRQRLLTALVISACSVAVLLALLGMLFDFAGSISKPSIVHGEHLTVHIRKGRGEPNSDLTTGNQAVRSSPQHAIESAEFAEFQREVAPVDSPEPLPDTPPVRDWHSIANEAAKAIVDEYFRQEETRAAMWRQSRSIIFQPAGDMVLKQEEPIIADIRFTPRVHVLGLGVTIGSCFIGIPIAGVPVEQRTVAITLIVCAQHSG